MALQRCTLKHAMERLGTDMRPLQYDCHILRLTKYANDHFICLVSPAVGQWNRPKEPPLGLFAFANLGWGIRKGVARMPRNRWMLILSACLRLVAHRDTCTHLFGGWGGRGVSWPYYSCRDGAGGFATLLMKVPPCFRLTHGGTSPRYEPLVQAP